MIEIKDIVEKPCELYGPDDKLIGLVKTEISFEDVRFQIQEQQAEGYYIKFDGKAHRIDKYGTLENWPYGLFDGSVRLTSKIIMGAIDKKKAEKDNNL